MERDARYSTVAIWFHWTIAALVIFNLAVGLLHDGVPALRSLMPAHKAVGITVLLLTAMRVSWRLVHRPPPLPDTVSPAERGIAHAVHWTLYALLILMPLTGWMMVSGPEHRRPLTWFGAFDIPYLPVSAATSETGANGHGLLGWLMLALVALHIAGALRHHYLLRDRTLVRIAPVMGGD